MTGPLARAAATLAMTMAVALATAAMVRSGPVLADSTSDGAPVLDASDAAFGMETRAASFSLSGVSPAEPIASVRTLPAGPSPDGRFALVSPGDGRTPGTTTTSLMIMAVPGSIAGAGVSGLLALAGLLGIRRRRLRPPAA